MFYIFIFFILYSVAAFTTLLREGMFRWVVSDFLLCGLVGVALMSVLFVIARKIRRYDLVDVGWGLSFIAICVTSFILQDGNKFELDAQLVVTGLVIIWGSRLSYHILKRIRSTDREDERYVELRRHWTGNESFNMFVRVYLVQAALALVVCIPVIHINLFSDNGITPLAWFGITIWTFGFFYESIADIQLRRFVTDPKNRGKLMTEGLWKYSRHPNYFGELTQWLGIFIICLTIPFGWVGIAGIVTISYLILFVSGIPLNEKRFEGRQGWNEYKARTSVLVPLKPMPKKQTVDG